MSKRVKERGEEIKKGKQSGECKKKKKHIK